RLFYSWERLWRMVRTVIIRSEASELKEYAEMKEGLEKRISKEAWRCRSFEDLISSISCRRYPRGRLQRHLIHILLGVNHWTNRAYQRLGPAYIRLIGADGCGRALLRQMRSTAMLPVISRASLPENRYASDMLALERRASEMWELLVDSPDPGRETKSTPVIDRQDGY
ncbi:MAG: nucleotidyltransferase family protein, partial [Synergistales bacterium]|nr:nucleotidyltransferase family protein [Synergistales bacterium]